MISNEAVKRIMLIVLDDRWTPIYDQLKSIVETTELGSAPSLTLAVSLTVSRDGTVSCYVD
jgi:hypothetical protein